MKHHPHHPVTRKQQLCDKLLNQIQVLGEEHNHFQHSLPTAFLQDQPQIAEQIHTTKDKILKVRKLNQTLEKDEEKLKLEYIMLLKEKHTYVNKLKAIQNLGQNLDWEDSADILQKIRPLIETTKKRLKDARTPQQKQ